MSFNNAPSAGFVDARHCASTGRSSSRASASTAGAPCTQSDRIEIRRRARRQQRTQLVDRGFVLERAEVETERGALEKLRGRRDSRDEFVADRFRIRRAKPS